MSATAAMIAEVRRLANEPATTTYSDLLITGFVERYPMLDEVGEEPYIWSDDDPPVKSDNTDWTPTYNLYLAAADIWDEKAAAVAAQYDFKAGQSSYTQSQLQAQYLQMAERYRNKPTRGARLIP